MPNLYMARELPVCEVIYGAWFAWGSVANIEFDTVTNGFAGWRNFGHLCDEWVDPDKRWFITKAPPGPFVGDGIIWLMETLKDMENKGVPRDKIMHIAEVNGITQRFLEVSPDAL